MQPIQDLTVEDRVSRTQYQYSMEDIDAQELSVWSQKLIQQLHSATALRDVASDQQNGGLQADLVIDRDSASRLGILPAQIDDTLYDAFGQRQVSTIYTQLNQYHVVLEVDPQFQKDPESLDSIYVKSNTGTQVPLSAFSHIERTNATLAINHQGQFPVVTLSFNLAPGASLGEATKAIDAAEQAIQMPASIHTSFQGTAAAFRNSLSSEPLLILAAIITVYIVLGVLYESYIHPITILSTLPSAGVGALLALIITGNDLGVVSLIGIILLIGIVKKNAIMMIDFALEAERDEHKPPEEAIYQASLAALPSHHDDHDGGAVWRIAAGSGHGHRFRIASPAGHHDRRRIAGQPTADALHHSGGLPLVRPFVRSDSRDLDSATFRNSRQREISFERFVSIH